VFHPKHEPDNLALDGNVATVIAERINDATAILLEQKEPICCEVMKKLSHPVPLKMNAPHPIIQSHQKDQ
jgi:hypothetical protein